MQEEGIIQGRDDVKNRTLQKRRMMQEEDIIKRTDDAEGRAI